MIVVADSGSTKTDWRILDGSKEVGNYYTHGFNPYIQSTEEITALLQGELGGKIAHAMAVTEVYFYGAGCSSKKNNESVAQAIKTIFPGAEIEVNHDLLAAARAACGREAGVTAILGTGSNTCFYDGENILENVESLGFILGDEGSGAYIGKKLLQAYFYKELPAHVVDVFNNTYKMSKEEIFESVYKKPFPNRFLAAFSRFVKDNIAEPSVKKIVVSAFEDFFDNHVCRYAKHKEVPLNSVGSVGYHFKDVLIEVGKSKGVTVNRVLESPTPGLIEYHVGAFQRK
ncbi:MAG TPA: BadF/BadG/BcrA/BcrD ATPase family protein [Cytophagaceae bacterium]